MQEIIYSQSKILIVSVMLLSMLLSMEIGYRSGRRKQAKATEASKLQANAVLVSMLGLLALLLGFTFFAALQRYDERSRSVVDEANAIGTTYLRARLLPRELHNDVQALFRQYLAIRIQEGHIDATKPVLRDSLLHQTKLIQAQLWSQAVRAAELDGSYVTSGLFIQSLNQLIDSFGTRNAVLNRHVPEVVLFLMFATIVMTTATLGYASGIGGNRVTLSAIVLVVLIALVIFIIIDLDRPRRGLILVSQKNLLNLEQTIGISQGRSAQPDSPPDTSRVTRQ